MKTREADIEKSNILQYLNIGKKYMQLPLDRFCYSKIMHHLRAGHVLSVSLLDVL